MKDLVILLGHLLTTIVKLLGPGGARSVGAESALMKQQLLVVNRFRRRSVAIRLRKPAAKASAVELMCANSGGKHIVAGRSNFPSQRD